MQTLAISLRWFKHTVFLIEADHISSAVEYRAALLAHVEMLLHGGAQVWGDFVVKVIRNLAPHLFAGHYHGLVPFANDNLLLQLPPRPGANRSRNISRARRSRVLTDAVETPRAF